VDRRGLDDINITKLPAPSGMSRNWPQPYEIVIKPNGGYVLPDLPFLHKGDGITVPGGDSYWVENARQVPVQVGGDTGHTVWSWVYRVTRDTSNDPDPWDEDNPTFGTSQFGR
jgi:hypothetical protein